MSGRDHGAPAVHSFGATNPTTLIGTANTYVGGIFQLNAAGRLFGLRMWRPASDVQAHWAHVIDASNDQLLRSACFMDVAQGATAGWQQLWLRPVLRMDTSKAYRIYVAYPGGNGYRITNGSGGVNHNGIIYHNGFQQTGFDPTVSPSTNSHANGVDLLVYFD